MKKKIRVVHVDDQEKQLAVVKKILQEFDNIELVAQFTDAENAREFLLNTEIDFAILDIEMPVNDGFWLAEALKGSGIEIVFLTSYPDFSLKAFDACAIHYILKPITKELLEEVIKRYENIRGHGKFDSFNQDERITELIDNYFNKTSYPKRIFIHNVHKTTVLNLDDVLYMVSSGQYTTFKTKDGQKHTASKILKTYSEALKNHPDFVRIHRANIVNKKNVKAILRDKHKLAVMMTDGVELDVSPQKRDEIYDMIMK
jgi:DNA-binding LytR/AlgR family response regulator